MQTDILRQGDVLIQRVDSIPKTAKKTSSLTLALGEVTGHHHSFENGSVQLFDNTSPQGDDPVKWFEVKSKQATLGHQEHGKMTVSEGQYKVTIEREYNPFDNVVRQVMD